MKRTALIVIILLTLGLILTAYLMYTHEMPDQVARTPDYTLTAAELLDAFEANIVTASSRYVNKIVQFTGTLKSVDTSGSLTIGAKGRRAEIIMAVDPRYKKFLIGVSSGEVVIVQGVCGSYTPDETSSDDMLASLGATLRFRSGGIKQ